MFVIAMSLSYYKLGLLVIFLNHQPIHFDLNNATNLRHRTSHNMLPHNIEIIDYCSVIPLYALRQTFGSRPGENGVRGLRTNLRY